MRCGSTNISDHLLLIPDVFVNNLVAIAAEYPRLDKNREHLVNKEAGQRKRPSRRRWRGVAVAASAVLLLGGGYATANAATQSGTGKRTTAPRPQIRNA